MANYIWKTVAWRNFAPDTIDCAMEVHDDPGDIVPGGRAPALGQINELTKKGWEVFQIETYPVCYARNKSFKPIGEDTVEQRTDVRNLTRYHLRHQLPQITQKQEPAFEARDPDSKFR